MKPTNVKVHMFRDQASGTNWVFVARDPRVLDRLGHFSVVHRAVLGVGEDRLEFPDEVSDGPVWTDDYSDLVSILE